MALHYQPLTYLWLKVAKQESYTPLLEYLKQYSQVEIKELQSYKR